MLRIFITLVFSLAFFSCSIYKKGIILDAGSVEVSTSKQMALNNYTFDTFDRFEFDVYTQDGERLIDPDLELARLLLDGGGGFGIQRLSTKEHFYEIRQNGEVILPMVGNVMLKGKTIYESQLILQDLFAEFYEKPLVKIEFLNKRVFVIGAVSKVVPLLNDPTSLFEVLAASGALQEDTRADRIRIIRGQGDQAEIFIVDLSTQDQMKKSWVSIQPNDVIYVEPIVRPVMASIKDFAPILSIITTSIALWLAIKGL